MDATDQKQAEPQEPSKLPSKISGAWQGRLKKLGALFAAIAAAGTIVGGLTGYWNAWKAVKSELQPIAKQPAQNVQAATVSKGPTVAVTQFSNESGDPGVAVVADGLTRQTIATLSKWNAFRVLGVATAKPLSGQAPVASDAASHPDADYVVSGEVQRTGDFTRVTFRVANARTGSQLWSKTFELKGATASDLESVVGQASAAITSPSGITGAEYIRARSKAIAELTPYECIIQATGVPGAVHTTESVLRARTCLEALVKQEPTNAMAWAALSVAYFQQRIWGFGLPPDQAADVDKRAYLTQEVLASATKAVELAPYEPFASGNLAQAYWIACDRDRLRAEASRALELDPNNAVRRGNLGAYIAYSGYWDEGIAQVERAVAVLSPQVPPFWWWAIADRHGVRGEYQQAYDTLQKGWQEKNWIARLGAARDLARLGRSDDARRQVDAVMKLKPGLTIREVDVYYRMWCFEPSYIQKMNEELRLAGLQE